MSERSPRVRFEMAHIYNNYFEGSLKHNGMRPLSSNTQGYRALVGATFAPAIPAISTGRHKRVP